MKYIQAVGRPLFYMWIYSTPSTAYSRVSRLQYCTLCTVITFTVLYPVYSRQQSHVYSTVPFTVCWFICKELPSSSQYISSFGRSVHVVIRSSTRQLAVHLQANQVYINPVCGMSSSHTATISATLTIIQICFLSSLCDCVKNDEQTLNQYYISTK